jgi:hypothetical protein
VLEEHGLSVRKVHFVAMPFPEMAQALHSHAIDEARVQRVANAMYQFGLLSQPFHVSSMLGGL